MAQYLHITKHLWVSQVALVVENSLANAGDIRDMGSIPGLGRSPGGHGDPLQYYCLKNPMDRGAWRATMHSVTESDGTEVTAQCKHFLQPWKYVLLTHEGVQRDKIQALPQKVKTELWLLNKLLLGLKHIVSSLNHFPLRWVWPEGLWYCQTWKELSRYN